MKQTVKDVINQLEKMNPNDTVFSLIYSKDDVKELEDYYSQPSSYPYNDELAERVLSNMDNYDVIYECIYNCMGEEVSYQVDKLSRESTIQQEEAPSY